MNITSLIKTTFSQRPLLVTGLCMLVAGLPVSLFLTSLSQFFLAGSFFLEGKPVSQKLKRFLSLPVAWLLVLFWLLHVAGLLWTTDLPEGLKDVRIKLPLIVLPVILAGSGPLQPVQFRFVLRVFLLAVFAGTLVSTAVLIGWIPVKIDDIRDIFIFHISHIRFALFLCFSIACILWLIPFESLMNRLLLALLGVWNVIFLYIMESMTGVIILLGLLLIFSVYYFIRRSGSLLRLILAAAFLLASGWLVLRITQAYASANLCREEQIDYTEVTHEGNAYVSDSTLRVFENGFRVWVYVCDPELKAEWEKRSTIPFEGNNKLLQPLRTSLIRFMASKGMRKDGEHVRLLTNEEIVAIENGIPNVSYMHLTGFERRIKEIAWEYVQYTRGLDPNDHSLTQRLEFHKAAFEIIAEHPWLGTGTGDMPVAYAKAYADIHSPLRESNRLRAHNQFLSIAVALGIPCLFYFVFVMFYLLRAGSGNRLFIAAWFILTVSMFSEDTLETQTGATFFALMMMLLLVSCPPEQKMDDETEFIA